MSSDKEVIAQLGGPTKVAQLLGCSVQRVQNWTVRGIPAQVKLDHPDLFLQHALAKAVQSISGNAELRGQHEDIAGVAIHPS